MTFYKFTIISFLIIFFNGSLTLRNPHLDITKTGLDTIYPASTGLAFVVDVNNTSGDGYDLELMSDKCCLAVGEEINCDLLEVIGSCVERLPRGTLKTMKLIAPILDPFERVGHCIFHLDSKSTNRRRKTMRNKIKIDFDTRLQNREQSMVIPRDVRQCNEIDEDPFNDCEIVDCDSYYNGKKSYYNSKIRKCTEIPTCLSDSTILTVYDTTSNKCMKDELKREDIEFVKALLEGKGRNPKDIMIIKNMKNTRPKPDIKDTKYKHRGRTGALKAKTKCTEKEEDITEIGPQDNLPMDSEKDIINYLRISTEASLIRNDAEKLKDVVIAPESAFNIHCFNYIFRSFTVNMLGAVVLVQCCCIIVMVCFLPKSCICHKGKIIRKFIRQDASVTTPLIDTSNIDTETTNYTSESNIDKKIKCYKACQREVDMKVSLSDDILSKCVTRRDWHSKPLKYTPKTHITNSEMCEIEENAEYDNKTEMKRERLEKIPEGAVKEIQTTDVREREARSAICKSIFRKLEKGSDSEEKVPKYDSSEKEIKSHMYTEEKPKMLLDKEENIDIFNAVENATDKFSMSTEKAAQAEFSNDSIDDFLSERGMMYLAGDDISKYSLSTSSHLKNSTQSSTSSRTSKNNIIKNVFSIFRRNSKVGPLSDPGTKKAGLNMEVIHMSHASLNSSSNNGSEYLKCLKRAKDSRTSL